MQIEANAAQDQASEGEGAVLLLWWRSLLKESSTLLFQKQGGNKSVSPSLQHSNSESQEGLTLDMSDTIGIDRGRKRSLLPTSHSDPNLASPSPLLPFIDGDAVSSYSEDCTAAAVAQSDVTSKLSAAFAERNRRRIPRSVNLQRATLPHGRFSSAEVKDDDNGVDVKFVTVFGGVPLSSSSSSSSDLRRFRPHLIQVSPQHQKSLTNEEKDLPIGGSPMTFCHSHIGAAVASFEASLPVDGAIINGGDGGITPVTGLFLRGQEQNRTNDTDHSDAGHHIDVVVPLNDSLVPVPSTRRTLNAHLESRERSELLLDNMACINEALNLQRSDNEDFNDEDPDCASSDEESSLSSYQKDDGFLWGV